MERRVASQIIEAIVAFDPKVAALDHLSEQISDPEERKTFRRRLGDLMGRLYADFMIPILRQYPDLDPDK